VLAVARALALIGIVLIAAAGALWLLARVGLSQVPGSIVIRRGTFTLWAPVGLWIAVSVVLTILLNLVARLFR
jgi:hypothetical protein